MQCTRLPLPLHGLEPCARGAPPERPTRVHRDCSGSAGTAWALHTPEIQQPLAPGAAGPRPRPNSTGACLNGSSLGRPNFCVWPLQLSAPLRTGAGLVRGEGCWGLPPLPLLCLQVGPLLLRSLLAGSGSSTSLSAASAGQQVQGQAPASLGSWAAADAVRTAQRDIRSGELAVAGQPACRGERGHRVWQCALQGGAQGGGGRIPADQLARRKVLLTRVPLAAALAACVCGPWLTGLNGQRVCAAPEQFTDPDCRGFEQAPGSFAQERCVCSPEHLASFQDFVRRAGPRMHRRQGSELGGDCCEHTHPACELPNLPCACKQARRLVADCTGAC